MHYIYGMLIMSIVHKPCPTPPPPLPPARLQFGVACYLGNWFVCVNDEHAVLFIQVLKSYKLAGTSATAVKSIEFARRGRYAQSKTLFDSLTMFKIAREVTTGQVA